MINGRKLKSADRAGVGMRHASSRIGAHPWLKMGGIAAVATIVLTGCGASDGVPQAPTSTATQSGGDEHAAFLDIYRELIETNTTGSQGDCTEAAGKMAARLAAAGYPAEDLVQFAPPEFPNEGGLVATLEGIDSTAKPILLLAHIDVVEANPADWKHDPFTLTEDDGYFYGRGALDDKAMAAIYVDSLIRYRQENFKPERPIRIALTCGEEGGHNTDGAQWLNENRPDLVDAAFVVNEGLYGLLDDNEKPTFFGVQLAEKGSQSFALEVTDKGGHSSQPGSFNAISALGGALDRLAAAPFPVLLNDITKAYFTGLAPLYPGEVGDAMRAIVADQNDAAAATTLSKNPLFNAMMRTTCIPTTIEGGSAKTALPERTVANVNCRMLPGTNPQEVQDFIAKSVNDPKVSVKPATPFSSYVAKEAPLTSEILDPAKSVAQSIWPGITVVPTMSTGASDAIFFGDTPVYGFNGGVFMKQGEHNIHAANERIRVNALYEERDLLYNVTKEYSMTG